MIKIYKYRELSRKLTRLNCSRKLSNACDPCRKPCPPSYVCKQKPVDPDYQGFWECAKKVDHWVLRCKKPKDSRPYRNIFFFICLPMCACLFFNAYYMTPPPRRPKYIEFEYLRLRKHTFPWDPVKQRTPFHNSYYNALPGGYEFEVPEEEEFDPRCQDCPTK